jgi:stress response protein YsnF
MKRRAGRDDRAPLDRSAERARPAGASTEATVGLEARVEPGVGGGWTVRVPLRAERVRTERETVVREEVVLRPRMVAGVERVEGTVSREELRVEVSGDLDATQPIVRQ